MEFSSGCGSDDAWITSGTSALLLESSRRQRAVFSTGGGAAAELYRTAPPCYTHGCRSMIDSLRFVFLTDVFVKSAGQGEGLHGSLNGICHARRCCVAFAGHVAVIALCGDTYQPKIF
jgi:hypothetical protein